MESFLSKSKLALINNLSSFSKVHVVIGNEACDLDSAVCALVWAYFLFKTAYNPTITDQLIIPMLDIIESDYKLKTEVTYYFSKFGLNHNQLIFRDNSSINLKDLHESDKLLLTLVDHNALSTYHSNLASSVIEIIDHHEKHLTKYNECCDICIEPVGSCATLVAEKIYNSQRNCIMDPIIIELLYASKACHRLELQLPPYVGIFPKNRPEFFNIKQPSAIILDTVNLNPEARRATAKDWKIIERLEGHLPGLFENRRYIYLALLKAKADILELTDSDLLRKDLKSLTNKDGSFVIALCSFPLLVQNVIEKRKTSLFVSLRDFSRDHKYQALVLLGVDLIAELNMPNNDNDQNLSVKSPSSNLRRDLAIFGEEPELIQNISQYLRQYDDYGLGLIPITDYDDFFDASQAGTFLLFSQKNVQITRKKILPALKQFLGDYSHANSSNIIIYP